MSVPTISVTVPEHTIQVGVGTTISTGGGPNAATEEMVAEAIAAHREASNPHPQYLTQLAADGLYASSAALTDLAGDIDDAIDAHEAASNPHPVYLTQAEADALYADAADLAAQASTLDGNITAAVTAHTAAGDPHPQYALETDPRLTDSRTPTAHTHTASQVSDSTATGRSVLTAASAAAARAAIGAAASGPIDYDSLPSGAVLNVKEVAGSYTRPTARTDVCVIFTGAAEPGSVALDGDKWDQTA